MAKIVETLGGALGDHPSMPVLPAARTAVTPPTGSEGYDESY